MTYVRSMWTAGGTSRPGLVTWHVRKACAPHFEGELARIHVVEDLVRRNSGRGFLRRLAIAAQLYDLQSDIWMRRRGKQQAARLARHSVIMWLLPQWIALWLTQKRWLRQPEAMEGAPEAIPSEVVE